MQIMKPRVLTNWLLAVSVIIVAGCNGQSTSKSNTSQEDSHAHAHELDAHAGHAHAEEGPHRGTLIELGHGEYHAEVVASLESVTVWLLDKSAKREVATDAKCVNINLLHDDQPQQFQLLAASMAAPQEGKPTVYTIKDRALVRGMRGSTKPPVISVTIAGCAYRGEYRESHVH